MSSTHSYNLRSSNNVRRISTPEPTDLDQTFCVSVPIDLAALDQELASIIARKNAEWGFNFASGKLMNGSMRPIDWVPVQENAAPSLQPPPMTLGPER